MTKPTPDKSRAERNALKNEIYFCGCFWDANKKMFTKRCLNHLAISNGAIPVVKIKTATKGAAI